MHAREPALLPKDSVPGAGERPSRLGSRPRPRPLAHRLLDVQKDPAPAECLVGFSPAPAPQITPICKYNPAFSAAATAPPRPSASPWQSIHLSLAETSPQVLPSLGSFPLHDP